MSTRRDRRSLSEPTTVYAQISCLSFGLALLMWGIAPAVVERLVTGEPPQLLSLAVGAATLLTGLTYIGFLVLIGRGVRWALWAAYVLSLVLLTLSFAAAVLADRKLAASFMLVLSGCTAYTTWLAIAARGREKLDDTVGMRR